MQPTEVTSPRVMQSAGGENMEERNTKEVILITGLCIVLGLITFIYALLFIVNPILLKTSFTWLFTIVLIENVLYKTWQICVVIYFVYVLYYLFSGKKK